MPIYIPSDKYKKRMKAMEEGYSFDDPQYIPVDMNGREVFMDKDTSKNIKRAEKGNREVYGLDYPTG